MGRGGGRCTHCLYRGSFTSKYGSNCSKGLCTVYISTALLGAFTVYIATQYQLPCTHCNSITCVHTYSDSSNAESIQYLNNNRSLPIYSCQNKLRTSSLHTVRAILDCPADLLCSSHPANISINCAFVVDTSKLRDCNDIKCDDCGAWKQTKTATNHLKLTFDKL